MNEPDQIELNDLGARRRQGEIEILSTIYEGDEAGDMNAVQASSFFHALRKTALATVQQLMNCLLTMVMTVAAWAKTFWCKCTECSIPAMGSSQPVSTFGLLSAGSSGCYEPDLDITITARKKVIFVLWLSLFVVGLDAALMANAIPKITVDFGSYEDICCVPALLEAKGLYLVHDHLRK
ncbi:uncharacterized protein LAJ45_03236 [Morchella importuna]|uniref:uncharacterized protein n=1 Tax=Morchella importuna TaxID=1174673 RepID=UPI001E8D67DC|nr:uncharacterized protein LAJ45_03236 [Morchella importuna]KAH8152396.1 hypothetical protein LAJ45_03236 [Morchella importuna]